jgi:hypothetical protein
MSDDAPAALRTSIASRFAVRLHCALILLACFGVGLFVTHLLLAAGVDTMWLRYALALFAAYLTFLLGVRIWLWYAGYDRRILPSRRASLLDSADVPSFSGGGGGSGSVGIPGFRGGGGSSGGGGASLNFDGATTSAGRTAGGFFSGSHGGSSGGGFDLGDDGWVLVALIAVLLAVSGAVVWLIYAAPTILADAAFAAMLSAGLVKSTKHIASGGWVASVVGHTWIAFGFVFVLALAFAIVAQHRFPEARTLADVVRRL